MVNYLVKTFILAVFSFVIIFFYYFGSTFHIENFDGYIAYIIIVGIVYFIYKISQFEKSEVIASFSLMKIFGFFMLHLFILSCLFFHYNGLSFGNGFIFYIKMFGYMLLPILLVLVSLSFGKKITSYLEYVQNESKIYNFIISLGLGFFSFVFLLDIIGILGFYNYYVVFLIIGGFIFYSYKELINIFKGIIEYKFDVEIEEGSFLKLVSTEFLFIVSTLVICVSLISIFRPFPIGWDDLGSYMNKPHLMAQAGEIIALGQMYAWQTFTGIGYMFGSATQAFYLNNVGGILSFIVLVLVIFDLLKSVGKKDEKTFINIPMLVGTIFISMPMVVFQQAKDMKLDPGLFFISTIVVYLIIKYYLHLDNKTYIEKVKGFVNEKILHKSFNKNNLLIILVIGILSGFAFSIKFTSLLLISGVFGIIFFTRLGIVGFLAYLSFYFAIFTKANLWKMMNVTINPDNINGFENIIFFSLSIIGVILFLISLKINKDVIKKFFLEFGIYFLGIIIALIPWLGKNIVEAYPEISISKFIGGKPDSFQWDKTDILTPDEISKIQLEKQRERMSSEGTSSNEDLGRYFGYEQGANNYIKLPWNLTMQVNQSGEYTDIGYLFLALLPVLFLFLPFRRKSYAYLIVLFLILELLIFIKPDNNLIERSSLKISDKSIEKILNLNDSVFQKSSNTKNIYDIDISKYIGVGDINKFVDEVNTFEVVEKRVVDLFYTEMKNKVLNHELGEKIDLTLTSMNDEDFNLIKELRELNSSIVVFKKDINSIENLESIIINEGLEKDKDKLIELWKSNRSINQLLTDFMSSYKLPYGYLLVFVLFILPTIILLLVLNTDKKGETQRVNLFKMNLIFASFYTFLWAISAYGIVWYGVTMYFSFLLAIAIGIYYLSFYTEKDSEATFYTKLFSSIILLIIVLIYFINNVFPHSFNNLKGAGYEQYKLGQLTESQSNYIYHPEYLKILFHTNIDEDKREDFLKENISDNIEKLVASIEKMDIYTVSSILTELKTLPEYQSYKYDAQLSLNKIYKYISNPPIEYKSDAGIYRIGTFLKYHISENNKRLLEDDLLFNFSDYIYNTNIGTTVDNFKKIGLSYLLFDLNAATIDKDERHNLTTRYDKLLSTVTSDRLELIETDSLCLKLGLEEFDKSEKLSKDKDRFMTIAGVNYESYTDDGTVIERETKLFACYQAINQLIKDNKIDSTNYNYLLPINNYITTNASDFKTDNEVYKFLQKQVKHGYKALFKVID